MSEIRSQSCLVPRRLSLDENALSSVPFPWSLALHHLSLAFPARLYHAKNEAPEDEVDPRAKGLQCTTGIKEWFIIRVLHAYCCFIGDSF